MRVLSYNIHKGIGGRDRRYRLERIIDVIEAENPDLICLQEVDRNVKRSRFDDQPAKLAERFTPLGTSFQFNHKVKAGGYGNLILSRWAFRESHQISLRRGRRKNRGAQLVVVETPEGPLQVVHWHLGLSEAERHWQIRHLLEHRLYRHSANLPTLILGDSNDWRNTLGPGPFAANGLKQITHPPSRFRSFPAMMEMVSLDKAYASDKVSVKAARIVKGPLARQASDHLPLVIDLHLSAT